MSKKYLARYRARYLISVDTQFYFEKDNQSKKEKYPKKKSLSSEMKIATRYM